MTTLKHIRFGTGTLISEENGKVTIEFNNGIKTLIVAFAKLTNEDGTLFTGTTGEVIVSEKPVSKYKKSTSKKLNPSNFMSKENWENSKYSTMSDEDFKAEREADKWGSKSF